MSSEFTLIHEKENNAVKVFLSGEIDIYNTQKLKDELYNIVDDNKSDIKMDCKKLEYIDSTGLGVLVGILKKVKEYKKEIYIYNLKDSIKKLFIITGLEKLFKIK